MGVWTPGIIAWSHESFSLRKICLPFTHPRYHEADRKKPQRLESVRSENVSISRASRMTRECLTLSTHFLAFAQRRNPIAWVQGIKRDSSKLRSHYLNTGLGIGDQYWRISVWGWSETGSVGYVIVVQVMWKSVPHSGSRQDQTNRCPLIKSDIFLQSKGMIILLIKFEEFQEFEHIEILPEGRTRPNESSGSFADELVITVTFDRKSTRQLCINLNQQRVE